GVDRVSIPVHEVDVARAGGVTQGRLIVRDAGIDVYLPGVERLRRRGVVDDGLVGAEAVVEAGDGVRRDVPRRKRLDVVFRVEGLVLCGNQLNRLGIDHDDVVRRPRGQTGDGAEVALPGFIDHPVPGEEVVGDGEGDGLPIRIDHPAVEGRAEREVVRVNVVTLVVDVQDVELAAQRHVRGGIGVNVGADDAANVRAAAVVDLDDVAVLQPVVGNPNGVGCRVHRVARRVRGKDLVVGGRGSGSRRRLDNPGYGDVPTGMDCRTTQRAVDNRCDGRVGYRAPDAGQAVGDALGRGVGIRVLGSFDR